MAERTSERSAPLSRLVRYTAAHRTQTGLATASSILNKLFDLFPPVLIGVAVDIVVERQDSLLARWGLPDPADQLVALAIATVAIWALESVFEFAQKWWWRTLAQTVQHELRLDAYGQVQRLDQSWFQEASTGRILAILNDDVNQLERFLDGGANAILQVGTTVVLVSATFLWLSPTVALLAMLPIPVIGMGSFWFTARIGPRYAAVRERASLVSGQIAANLGGIEVIKGFTAEAHEVERVRALSGAYRMANADAIRLSSAFSPAIRMAIVVGFTATLVVGGQQALAGDLEVGAYSVLVFLTQRLLWPLTSLGEVVDQYQRAMASAARVFQLLDRQPEVVDGPEVLANVTGAVHFVGVDFAYPGREPILQRFHLDVPAGQTLAVVGPTGSGKSTLVRLLLRLYDPDGGCVTLDGHDLRTLTLSVPRRAVGLVSQQVFLFPGTVRDNVTYGDRDATDAQVEAALRAAEAWEFVVALPQQLHTPIGERGQKLSGGQAQRLSLARAILTDPAILVLDEATSAVDNETEAAIQRSLATVSRGRTTLVIAHRLSTIVESDRIVVMDGGRIIEEGTHGDLLAHHGMYARLWRIQTGASADPA